MDRRELSLIVLGIALISLIASMILSANPILAAGTTTQTREECGATQLSVAGYGKVYFTPDEASATFVAIGQAGSAHEALRLSASKASAIIDALKGLGIKDEDIKTIGITVNPRYDWDAKPPKIIGYEASYILSVKIRDIDLVGKVIDTAFAAGADRVYGIQFTISEDERRDLILKAIEAAMRDAEMKAKAAASAAGMRIVGIKSINLSPQYTPPIRPPLAAEMKGAEIPIQPGKGSVSASVSVIYILTAK